MTVARPRIARAFAPGHVTGVFRPETSGRDPRGRGSVGAGIVLELGVTAEARFSPGPRSRVVMLGDGPGPWSISEEAARRMAPHARGVLAVRLSHDLPVGQGFGTSAAGALATALAVGSLSHHSTAHAVGVAHLADYFGGGGLGGVSAILGGGLEVRTRAGVPPFGRVRHRKFAPALIIGVVGGPIPSPSVLRDPAALRRIESASLGWERLARRPTDDAFFEISERFTDRSGLGSPTVGRVVSAMRRRGASACQAMFGRSFFARPRSAAARSACIDWLNQEGIRGVELHAAVRGARLL